MPSNLEDIKIKLITMKEKTEEAFDRESDACSKLQKTNDDAFAKETEAAGCKRRIQLLRQKMASTVAEMEEKKKRLQDCKEKADIEGDKGRELSHAEVETDEQLRTIEMQVQDASSDAESALMRLNDAQRKLTVVENDASRSQDRKDRALKRICELEAMIRTAGENLRKLRESDVLAVERENDSEQKIKILEEELSEKIKCCEDSERKIQTLLRRVNELSTEIEVWSDKKRFLEDEIVAMGELEG